MTQPYQSPPRKGMPAALIVALCVAIPCLLGLLAVGGVGAALYFVRDELAAEFPYGSQETIDYETTQIIRPVWQKTIPGNAENAGWLNINAAGTQAALVLDNFVGLFDLVNQTAWTAPLPEPAGALAFADDGRVLVVSTGTIHHLSPEGNVLNSVPFPKPPHPQWVSYPWDMEGSLFLYRQASGGGQEESWVLVDLTTGQEILSHSAENILRVDISENQREALFLTGDASSQRIAIHHLDNPFAEPERRFFQFPFEPWNLWTDEKWMVIESPDGVEILDRQTGTEIAELGGEYFFWSGFRAGEQLVFIEPDFIDITLGRGVYRLLGRGDEWGMEYAAARNNRGIIAALGERGNLLVFDVTDEPGLRASPSRPQPATETPPAQ